MNLARHIEILLLEHDCVIVPKIGGFIANHAPAEYNEKKDYLFLPPYRNICFNQELKANDGLLVQSYMTAYDASYPDAYKQMEMDIEDVLQEIELNGEYSFNGIGVMRKGINGNITFEPLISGLLTPSLFGLYSIEVKSLKEVKKEKEILKNVQATNVLPIQSETLERRVANGENQKDTFISDKKGNLTIHINRRWIDMSIAAIASVILFFLFFYPAIDNNPEKDTCVAGMPIAKEAKIDKKQKNNPSNNNKANSNPQKKEQTQKNNSKKVNAKKASDNKQKNNPAPNNDKKTNASKGRFVIVLASYISKNNAEAFIKKLSDQGFKEGRYVKDGKISRIIYSGYSSYEEATKALKMMRSKNQTFKEAWVLDLNK